MNKPGPTQPTPDSVSSLLLAEHTGLGSVSFCNCGTVHLSVGAITMRLAPDAFAQLLHMCQQAADQLAIEALMRTTEINPLTH